MIKSLYRSGSGNINGLDAIDDCKCASPTPTVAFADCYTQDTLYSFDGSDGWAYCQRPGYFM